MIFSENRFPLFRIMLWIESCLKDATVNRSPDAMYMASTVIFTATMFGMLKRQTPHINSSKGDP